jgi:hypothetical protein
LGRNKAQTRIVNSAVNSSSFQSLTNGLPANSYTLGLDYKFSDLWSLHGKFTHGKVAITNARYDSPELELSYNANKSWTVALAAIRSKQEYQPTIFAMGPTLTYNF